MSNKIISKQILINVLTNLHVGADDAVTGVVDNLVQKDPITGIPVIHGSSLKGAIREHMEIDDNSIWTDIFGNRPNEKNENNKKQGKINFFASDMIFLPVRSDKNPYYITTSPFAIKEFLTKSKFHEINLGEGLEKALTKLGQVAVEEKPLCEDNGVILEDEKSDDLTKFISIEDLKIIKEYFKLDTKIAVFSEGEFKYSCDNLPVIARNHLENGESKNLWYEEVVPRKSMFYTFFSFRQSNEKIYAEFSKSLLTRMQIGANATIGYGLCEFRQVGG